LPRGREPRRAGGWCRRRPAPAGAVLAGDDRERLGVAAEERVRGEAEVVRRGGADGVTRPAGAGCRGNDVGPGHGPEFLDGEFAGRDRPGRGHRAVAAEQRHATAVPEADLVDPTAEPVGGQPPPGHLDVAVDDDRVAAGGPHRDERAPGQRDDARLGAHGRHGRRNRDVDGVAPGQSHLAPRGQRHRPGRGDRHSSTHARHPLTGGRMPSAHVRDRAPSVSPAGLTAGGSVRA
jgi:hypothetical protein